MLMFILLMAHSSFANELIEQNKKQSKKLNDKTLSAAVIQFSEFEKGAGIYPLTMIVTKNYLRIDDTQEGNDFILFNRNERAIYSVNSEEQQIIKIGYAPVDMKSPIELSLQTKELVVDKDAPLVAGQQTKHYQIYVNDLLCYEQVVVPNLLPDIVSALKQFKQVLAGQQAETLRYTPADLHEPCDLARNTFYSDTYFEKGFSIIEKDFQTSSKHHVIYRSRSLIKYSNEQVASNLFNLPKYNIITLP